MAQQNILQDAEMVKKMEDALGVLSERYAIYLETWEEGLTPQQESDIFQVLIKATLWENYSVIKWDFDNMKVIGRVGTVQIETTAKNLGNDEYEFESAIII